jgi:hypothetical protein
MSVKCTQPQSCKPAPFPRVLTRDDPNPTSAPPIRQGATLRVCSTGDMLRSGADGRQQAPLLLVRGALRLEAEGATERVKGGTQCGSFACCHKQSCAQCAGCPRAAASPP